MIYASSRKYSVSDVKDLLREGQVDKVYSLILNDDSPDKWTDKIDLSGNVKELSSTIEKAVHDAYRSNDLSRRDKVNAIESFFYNAQRFYPKTIEKAVVTSVEPAKESYSQRPSGNDIADVITGEKAPKINHEYYEVPISPVYSGADTGGSYLSGMKEGASRFKEGVRDAFRGTKGYVAKGLATGLAALIFAFAPSIGNVETAPRRAVAAQESTSQIDKGYIRSLFQSCPTLFKKDQQVIETPSRQVEPTQSQVRETSRKELPYELSDGQKAFVMMKEDRAIDEINRGEYFCLDPSQLDDNNRAWAERNGPTGFVHSMLTDESRCQTDAYNNILWGMQGWNRMSGEKIYTGEDRVRVLPGDMSVTPGQDGFLDDFKRDKTLEEITGLVRLPNSVKHHFNPIYVDESCAKDAAADMGIIDGVVPDGWNERYYGLRS